MTYATHRDTLGMARAVWAHLEPYHALVYFAPEHRAVCDQAGLRGGWMAYFASRGAPLGAASPELVTAVFYNFHPAMVARALPDAWSYTTPADMLTLRLQAMDTALRRTLGPLIDSVELRQLAEVAMTVATAADVAGRPMFGANMALERPQPAHLALWHAATLLREHRGDGHIAALLAADIDGCQAHVMQAAAGAAPREQLQPHRGWTDTHWQAATDALHDRSWLHDDGTLTPDGQAVWERVATDTDRLAAAPLHAVGADTVHQLLTGMQPILTRLRYAGDIPYPNPMGLPAPPATGTEQDPGSG